MLATLSTYLPVKIKGSYRTQRVEVVLHMHMIDGALAKADFCQNMGCRYGKTVQNRE